MLTRYVIQQDDSLSLIAERFGVSEDALAQLNSHQIKNIHLIYEGNTLTIDLPEPIDSDGSRLPLPVPPTEMNGGNDTCSTALLEWVDVLYVPAHPISEKPMWYALSEEAKKKILEEKEVVAKGIQPQEAKGTLQYLNRLGVLSKFTTQAHEQFMTKDVALSYRTLLWTRYVITSESYGKYNPNDFLLSASALVGIDLEVKRGELAADEKVKNRALFYGTFTPLYYPDVDFESKDTVIRLQKTVNQQLRALVLNALDEQIAAMEKTAEREANHTVAENGAKFVYVDELNYFTTQSDKTLSDYVKRYGEAKAALKTEEHLALSSHEEARAYVEAWPQCLQRALDEVASPSSAVFEYRDYLACASALRYLNQHGVVVKEQCLRVDQLEGTSARNQGPKSLAHLPWRKSDYGKAKPLDITKDDVDTAIQNLYVELQGPKHDSPTTLFNFHDTFNHLDYDWSYYPTKALIAVIDATIEKYQSELAQLFGGNNTPFDVIFRRLLWAKRVALGRLSSLQMEAQSNAEKGSAGMRFVVTSSNVAMPAVLTALWDESTFKPKQANKPGFINDARYNDIQIVECSLLSDGQMFYVRGPQWYMPENEEALHCAQSLRHVRVINKQITFEKVTSDGKHLIEAKSLTEAVVALKDPKVTVGLFPLKQDQTLSSVFWQDSYHYQSGLAPTQDAPSYSADAGAQLLRFVTQAEGELNQPLDSYQNLISKPKQFGASGKLSATFTPLQGQISFTCWLPLTANVARPKYDTQNVQGQPNEWRWIDKRGITHPYPMGEFSACIAGSVYALAAVSCQLSSKLEVGPTHVSEGFGIKGNTVGLFDANVQAPYVFGDLMAAEQASMAQEASAAVNVFAGVEAGGKLGAEVYWKAPNESKPCKLGSIDGQLSVSAGWGAHAQFEIKVQGGVLLLIVDAGVVIGEGCAGKMAISLDAAATDTLLHHVFSLLKRSEFRRLSVFGEVDEHGRNESFELLNDLMTVVVATGLTVGSALLIPVTLWSDFKTQALSKKYAPAVAKRINIGDDEFIQRRMQNWVEKLPPETLCNLLSCLLQPQSSADTNHNQAQAIVQIMQWLANDHQDSLDVKQRQWKEALIAMGNLPKGEKNYTLEWETYKVQWFRLASFVESTGNHKLMVDFSRSSQQLCGNMVLTKAAVAHDVSRSFGVTTSDYVASQYAAYPVSSVANAHHIGQHAIVAVETGLGSGHWQLKQTEETMMEWSITDVF
ncbi:LysM peptidoglycan-binding domain-containing protein [Vibrio parahaemolyticus]|nr:LysM peptidoglycan-binding domain-containing protein [Vibrio parahaemolyticus]